MNTQLALLAALVTASASFRPLRGAEVLPQTPEVALGEEGASVELPLGHSQILKAPWPTTRISVADPQVADVQALTPERVLLLGKKIGSTDVFLWSAQEEVRHARVDVTADLAQLEASIGRLFPESEVKLSQVGEIVIVRGSLSRADDVKQLTEILTNSGVPFVDTSRLSGVQQVQIQVRVAEVSRRALRALGFNAFKVGPDAFGGMTIGSATGGALNPISIGVPGGVPATPPLPFSFTNPVNVSPLVTMFGGLTEHNLAVFVQALAEDQYLRLLAEPNLVATSGEEASFLAGGEFPIPVVQGGTAQSTSISIEYKEFGVRLSFRPTVLGEGKIRLRVAPEVSELSDTGAVEIQGFRIPGLITRRAETTLELRSGETFAMAGLISSKKDARNSRVPILGDIPIIGALFRSIRHERGETELVVLATASLVEPVSIPKVPPLPGSIQRNQNDWEIFLKSNFEGELPPVPPASRPAVLRTLKLDRLRGPGAWTTHEKGISRSMASHESWAETEGAESAEPTPAAGRDEQS